MKFSHVALVICIALVVCLTVSNISESHAQTQSGRQSANRQAVQPTFEYATLATQTNENNSGMVYTVTWNAGVQDIVGRSSVSLLDARRRLTAQLRAGNDNRTNLSVLLSSVGKDGWRLIESSQDESGTTRIFIRQSR